MLKSTVCWPGPMRTLRPVFPNEYCAGLTKQDVSYHFWIERCEVGKFPLRNREGRVNVPVFAGDVPIDTENGAPDCRVRMPVPCHPPRMASVTVPALERNRRP